MKRVLFLMAIVWGIGAASPVLASQPPSVAALPDFDRRLERLPVQPPELSPEQADAAALLQQRVPGVNLQVDRLLAAPNYAASPRGFLTGPQGAGKATTPAVANAFAAEDPQRPLKAFLQEHAALFGYGPEILNTAVATRDYVTPHNGLRTTVWEQRLDGVAVFEAVLISHVTKNGELVNVSSRLVPDVLSAADAGVPNRARVAAAPPISAQQAVVAAAKNLGTELNVNDVLPVSDAAPSADHEQRFTSDLLQGQAIAKLTWVPMGRGSLRICWQVFVTSRARPIELYRCLVDAQSGAVVARHGLTRSLQDATYNVYTSDSPSPFSPGHPIPLATQPPYVSRVMVTTAALDTNASPLGWIADNDNETKGNNVDAAMDWNGDMVLDLPRPQGTNRVFDFPLDLAQQPDTYGPAATVQLFYWANWMHDTLYGLGFTEAAGNYQDDNFGRGGLGMDAIQAHCQFGILSNTPAFRNNSFFMPMPDGYPGAVFMMTFNGPNPNRDASLDAEWTLHELAHGLSMRLVGGGVLMTMLQPNGMGEGWSDFFAMSLLSESRDDLNGNYAWGPYASYQLGSNNFANYYYGCRRYPYSTDMSKNPLTYKDIDPTQADPHTGIPINPLYGAISIGMADEVHFQGEFWCATLWEARVNLVRKYGYTNGNHMILQLVTDGMRLAPANPTYLEARDAIIQADLVDYGGANIVELWTAFAKRGLGGSAFAPDSSTTVGVIESFDMPGLVFVRASSSDALTGNGNGAIDPNECTEITVVLANNGANRAASIQATLSSLDTNVVVAQAESRYPNLLPGDRGTNLAPFRIYTKPQMTCGLPIQLALLVRSDVDVRTVRFRLDTGSLGTPTRFDSTNAVDIPDADFAGVDSPITVNGFAGRLGKVTVSLHLTHDWVGDLVLQLIGPDGTSATLVDASPKSGTNYGLACAPVSQRTTFDDKAALSIVAANAPYVGAFKPAEALVKFNLKDPVQVNGTWRLHVTDVLTNDLGTVQCWSLNLFPMECTDGGGECPSDLAVYSSPGLTLPVVGSNWTFSVTVANEGPNIARGVMLTNVLPAGVRYLTNDAGCNLWGGTVICSLGNVANGNAVNIHITVVPQVEGPATNTAVVTTLTPELVLTNNSSTFTTLVRPAAPLIVSAGSRLDAESFSPPSGAIDIGETVTLELALQNIGVLATSNLVATLPSGNGVLSPSGPQLYGALVPGEPAVSRSFTFTATGTNGGRVIAALQLQDGLKNLGTVSFTFGLSSVLSYSTLGGMNIPDQGPAALYPSPIFVTGLSGRISQLSVTLLGLSHSFPADLDVLLAGPGGQGVVLLSDAGGGAALQNASLTFTDAGYRLTDPQERLFSGSYHPVDFEPGDVLPAPAPLGPYATDLTSLNGLEPNGAWSLYIFDDSAGDSGRLTGGWTLDFKMVDPVNPTVDLQLAVTNTPARPLAGSNVLYTVTVVNRGPDTATGVVVTNYPPAALANIVAVSGGACVVTNGLVICQLGSVSNLATLTIGGKITASGAQIFGATVGGNEQDSNGSNNTNSVAMDVQPLADVGVSVSATSASVARGGRFAYDVVVTNRGPDAASALKLTNTLPAQVKWVSAAGSGWTVSATNRLVRGLLASLPAGDQSLLTIVCEAPDLVTLLTNAVVVGAGAPADLAGSNNTASVVVQVRDPEVFIVAAGSTLVKEGTLPPTGGIEPDERVTINFALRNMGIVNTVQLLAALREAGGITTPTGPMDYGELAAGGSAAERSFSFTAAGAAGNTLVATLDLQDGTNNLGSVTFPFILGGAQGAFGHTNRIAISDKSPASPYPATIVVSGLTGAVGKVTVTLTGLNHSYPDDIDALLVGPQGQGVILMSDAGGGTEITNALTLTFDDSADRALPDNSPLESGPFKPINYPPGDLFPAPAPEGPYGALLSNFRGASPNGAWSLYVVDDYLGGDGSLAGWSLTITTVGLIAQAAPGSAPRLLSSALGADGQFQFTIQANPGEVYEVQTSPDLKTWTPAGTCAVGAGTGQYTDPQAPGQPQRFYRAVRLP